MPHSLLSPLRSAYEASPPLVGPDDLRSLLNNGSPHPTPPWYRTFHSRQLLGILMTLLGILALGYLLLPSHLFNDASTPARPHRTPHSVEAPAPGGTVGSPAAAARPASPSDASPSDASAVREWDARPADTIGAVDPSSIPAPLPPEIVLTPRIEAVTPIPEPSRPGGDRPIDSVRRARDSVWNYAGVYMTSFFTPRSFTALNQRLGVQGFPEIKGSVFGSGLSYEFARPGPDSAAPITFPAFLYPAAHNYTPGVSIEWALQPEAVSGDGRMRASFSSWSVLADNNVYLKTYESSRLLLTLSIGVNFNSITLGQSATFDDLIGGTNPGILSLSRATWMLRPTLRYDYCFAGFQIGLSAGYTFSLNKASWRMRSSLQFDPGIAVGEGPDDSVGGFHLGFAFTLRGLESMTPSQK